MVATGYGARLTVTSTCSSMKNIYYNKEYSSRYASVIAFFANTSQNVILSQPANSYNSPIGLYYIGTGFSNVTLVQEIYLYDTSRTLTINNATNRVLIGAVSSSATASVSVNSTSEYCDTDGRYTGCIFIPDLGSGSLTTSPNASSYATIFLADLQLS